MRRITVREGVGLRIERFGLLANLSDGMVRELEQKDRQLFGNVPRHFDLAQKHFAALKAGDDSFRFHLCRQNPEQDKQTASSFGMLANSFDCRETHVLEKPV